MRLADAGVPVTVLESAPEPGGAVASRPLTLPGFVHDTCAGFFPMTLGSPAMRDIGLVDELDWVNPPIAMAHPFEDGTAITLHRDLGETAASLERTTPGSGRAWQQLMGPLLERRERVLRVALNSPPPRARDMLALTLALRRDALGLARHLLSSSATVGRELLGGERPAAWLSGSVVHSDLTPGSAGGAALALGLAFLAHAVGWGFPRGGAGQITDALVRRLTRAGGHLRCSTPAARLLTRHGRVIGVRVGGGEVLAADAVVLAVSAGPAAALLPADALPERLLTRLSRWRYGLGTLKVDFALSAQVPWRNLEARRAAVVHVAGELPELFEAHHRAAAGQVPARLAVLAGQHTLDDPSRSPAGHHTLYTYAHVPQRLDLPLDAAADRIQERIEQFAPGFHGIVLRRCARGPAELEQENPSLVGGDLAGGSCELDQQFVFRPAPELFRGRSPLPGLYLAGASVHPGPGTHGVSGAAAAQAILADRRWPRMTPPHRQRIHAA